MTHTRHTLLSLVALAAVACTGFSSAPGLTDPEGVGLEPGDAEEGAAEAGAAPGEAESLDRDDDDAGPLLTLISDASCENPCTFRTGGSLTPARVAYTADGWDIGESTSASDGFSIRYDFHTLGNRFIEVTAYGTDGRAIGAAGAWIDVVEAGDPGSPRSPLPEVPYFYQYANGLYPNSSCQNTVIAMVLAWRGWSGTPDTITEYWGKDYAQTPTGFSDLLTREAAYWGVDVASTARTNANFSDLHTLLNRGIPVPVHGYFTSYGHVVLVLGYDEDGYWVNDPAGEWAERFMGGYPGGWDATVGDAIYYPKAAFEAAVGTTDGWNPVPLWIHELSL